MALGQRLDLRQSQSLVMTPQLQQAIKLLQLSNIELGTYVDAELERNPLLEREDDQQSSAPEIDDQSRPEPGASSETAESIATSEEPPLDTDSAATWGDDFGADAVSGGDGALYAGWGLGTARGGSFDGDDMSPDQTLASQPTLRDHLFEQLQVDVRDPLDRAIGAHLIDSLDDSGWLTIPLDLIAERMGCSNVQVERALGIVQHFDPPGIFARTLSECLALQLKDRNRYDPAMAGIA